MTVDVQDPQSVEESNLPSSLFKHCSFTRVARTSKNQTLIQIAFKPKIIVDSKK